jgi:hypothetical protein
MDMTFFVFHYLISFLKSIKIKKKNTKIIDAVRMPNVKLSRIKGTKKKVRMKKEGKNTQKTKRDIFLTINN